MNISAYIPARIGSNRIAAKNLRLLNGLPLIAYAIRTIKKCRSLNSICVNTDSKEIAEVAREYGIASYLRSKELAISTTSTDEIVYDYLKSVKCDAVAVVNPTAPFLRPETIDRAVERFRRESPSALFTINSIKRHALFRGAWLNVDPEKRSPRTQDLEPVSYVNFIVAIFDAEMAVSRFEAEGRFLYSGDVLFEEIPEEESFDIDYEHEFRLAEAMMRLRDDGAVFEASYHHILDPTLDQRN